MSPLTQATQDYINIFNGYINVFQTWGQWIFFSLLTINIVIMCLWYAFDRDSFSDSVGQFIRKFFVIALFYTIMINHAWLISLVESFTDMGQTLTSIPIDPSSIVSTGISIANQVWNSVKSFSPFTITSGAMIMIICYVVIIFCFISIALQLAITMIITQLLVSISTFFLGFSALSATSQIARNILDVILGNCVKLLGIYLVVGSSAQTITMIESTIPTQAGNFDIYVWLLSGVILFWLLAKNVPEQLAKIVSGLVQETRGADAAAIAMSAVQYASVATATAQTMGTAAHLTGIATGQAAATTALSAASHMAGNSTSGSSAFGIGAKTLAGTASDVASSAKSSIADQFKHMASKLSGGEGIAKSAADIPGFAQRMHQKASSRLDAAKAKDSGASG